VRFFALRQSDATPEIQRSPSLLVTSSPAQTLPSQDIGDFGTRDGEGVPFFWSSMIPRRKETGAGLAV